MILLQREQVGLPTTENGGEAELPSEGAPAPRAVGSPAELAAQFDFRNLQLAEVNFSGEALDPAFLAEVRNGLEEFGFPSEELVQALQGEVAPLNSGGNPEVSPVGSVLVAVMTGLALFRRLKLFEARRSEGR